MAASTANAVGDPAGLTYTCSFPDTGEQRITVHTTAKFPSLGSVGSAISPRDASSTIVIPASVVDGLGRPDITSVDGAAVVGMTVTQNGKASDAPWAELTIPSTPVTAGSDLTVTAGGEVPTATVTEPGNVGFVAGDVKLYLNFRTAEGDQVPPGLLEVPCTLDSGQDAKIATVPVPRPAASTSRTPASSTSGSPKSSASTTETEGAQADGPIIGTAAADPALSVEPDPPLDVHGTPARTRLAATSTLAKLDQTVAFDYGFTFAYEMRDFIEDGIAYKDWLAENHVPATKQTVLLFGFMPVTSTNSVTETEKTKILTWTDATGLTRGKATTRQSAQVADVLVNGVPLDVGANCRSAEPFTAVLDSVGPYQPLTGGTLTGPYTMPPFAGCGTTEDLDPVLTGSLAGPGNSITAVTDEGCFLGQVLLAPLEHCTDLEATLTANAQFPQLGSVATTIRDAFNWESRAAGTTAAQVKTSMHIVFDEQVVSFLRQQGAVRLASGTVITGTATLTGPDGETYPVPFTRSLSQMTLPTTGQLRLQLPSQTFQLPVLTIPGRYVLRLDPALSVRMRPLRSNGQNTGLGTFDVPVRLEPAAQETKLVTVGMK